MYQTLIFDLDDTLSDDKENMVYAFRKVLEYRGEPYSREKGLAFYDFDKKFWNDRVNGRIKDPYKFQTDIEKTTWIRAERFIRFFKNISFQEAVALNELYMKSLKEHVIPIDGAYKLIHYLYHNYPNIRIVIATNSPKIAVSAKLEKLKILPYITTIFSAEDAGHMKPHKDFFLKLFHKLNLVTTKNVLLIGDDLEKDIRGGNENSLDTCWFNPNFNMVKTHIPTYEIHKLFDLIHIIKEEK